MTDKQTIIDDQKKTIHRLQDECTEKTNAIIALGEQLQRKQQSEEKLVKQIQTICEFINNRPETFKGINGSVDKIITDYAKHKEQECEESKYRLKKIAEFRQDYCMNCEDLLKPSHSCCGCNMSILRHLVEEQI